MEVIGYPKHIGCADDDDDRVGSFNFSWTDLHHIYGNKNMMSERQVSIACRSA